MNLPAISKEEAQWKEIIEGNRETFQRLVAPYLGELLRAAQREVEQRETAPPLTPEELLAETLRRAWQGRLHRPLQLRLRAWLLGTAFRALETESDIDEEKSWEWMPPEDLLGGKDAVAEPAIPSAQRTKALEERVRKLERRTRQAFLLNQIHGLSLRETAMILRMSLRETAGHIENARSHVARSLGFTSS